MKIICLPDDREVIVQQVLTLPHSNKAVVL